MIILGGVFNVLLGSALEAEGGNSFFKNVRIQTSLKLKKNTT